MTGVSHHTWLCFDFLKLDVCLGVQLSVLLEVSALVYSYIVLHSLGGSFTVILNVLSMAECWVASHPFTVINNGIRRNLGHKSLCTFTGIVRAVSPE